MDFVPLACEDVPAFVSYFVLTVIASAVSDLSYRETCFFLCDGDICRTLTICKHVAVDSDTIQSSCMTKVR